MSIVLNASSFEGPGSSFMIPYDTLSGVSTELVDVREGLDRVRVQMVSALLSTIFIGELHRSAIYPQPWVPTDMDRTAHRLRCVRREDPNMGSLRML